MTLTRRNFSIIVTLLFFHFILVIIQCKQTGSFSSFFTVLIWYSVDTNGSFSYHHLNNQATAWVLFSISSNCHILENLCREQFEYKEMLLTSFPFLERCVYLTVVDGDWDVVQPRLRFGEIPKVALFWLCCNETCPRTKVLKLESCTMILLQQKEKVKHPNFSVF